MNEWHPLPPPQMVPLSFVTGQAFHLGFMAGCEAASVFYMVFLSLVALAIPLGRWLRSSAFPPAILPVLLLLVCAASASADSTFPVTLAATHSGSLGASVYYYHSGSAGVTGYPSSVSPSGGTFAPITVQLTVSSAPGTTGSLSLQYDGLAQDAVSFTGSYTVPNAGGTTGGVGTGTGGTGTGGTGGTGGATSSAPCAGSYPSTVSPLLQGAPQPCDYFHASQGFNSSSAPVILAVLAVLMVILAIWLGHDTIMSIFKRLATGMTGGN